jgi:hypothetical protein
VPIVFGGITRGASIKTVMSGGQGEEDGSLAMLGAHSAINLA